MKRKPLRPKEVPAELRSTLDFESQHPNERGQTIIKKICKRCGAVRWSRATNIRRDLKKGYRGFCKHCLGLVLNRKPPLAPEEIPEEYQEYYNFEEQPMAPERQINVICPTCGRERFLSVSAIRTGKLSKRTYCRYCAHSVGRPKKHYAKGYIILRISALTGEDKKLAEQMSSNKIIAEHRLIMARHLNRPLTSCELVHHLNGLKDDNRLDNLKLVTKKAHHKGYGNFYQEWQEALTKIKALEQELHTYK